MKYKKINFSECRITKSNKHASWEWQTVNKRGNQPHTHTQVKTLEPKTK